MAAVYDPTRPAPSPADAEVSSADVPAEELRARQERLRKHEADLRDSGVFIRGYTAAGRLRYFAKAPDVAEALLRERFGESVKLSYQGASLRALRPHPFGSWLAEGSTMHVFYALPHNGERFAGCVATEEPDVVIVSLVIVDWLGPKTLIGGFTPSEATVELEAEVGERTVVDAFDNHPRPHWTTAAAVPLPRPQDL
jgi:hypothetical protein